MDPTLGRVKVEVDDDLIQVIPAEQVEQDDES